MQDRIIVVDMSSLGDLTPSEFCLLVDIIKNKGTGWLDPSKDEDRHLLRIYLLKLERKLYIKLNNNDILLRKKALDLSIRSDQNSQPILTNNGVTVEFVDKYRKLFKGKKVGAMGDRNACIKKFDWFFKTHPKYDEETILKATEKYIIECRNKEYIFLQQADYFIRKQDVDRIERSRLASYCEELDDSDNKPHSNGFDDPFIEKL